MMYRKLFLSLCMVLFSAVITTAQDMNQDTNQTVNQDVHQNVNQDTNQDMNQETNRDMSQAVNQDNPSEDKELSGMSIVGNDEAPKSLYIVPWKSSEIGVETSLDMMFNEGDVPLDRDVFKRQLKFYQVSTEK